MRNIEPSLPKDVLQALHKEHRDEAIELLRRHEGISSEQAKNRVYQYLEANPKVRMRGAGVIRQSRLNGLIWLGLIILMAATYLLLVG